jgi:hypothetical protein|tara:strand:- start:398 stop:577 length:180 start_codon:yes stop_codon:yes gene_type:complete
MEVARATGISYQEVYRWRYTKAKRGCNGHVPHKHQETILRAAAELKLSLKPADLVMIPA